MSLNSKQKWFCNNCGKEQFTTMVGANQVCSEECSHEIKLKRACSILGEEYTAEILEKSKGKLTL